MKKELLINSEIQPAIIPQNNDGAVVLGAIYDRRNFLSAMLNGSIGAVTGAPSGLVATFTIYSGDVVDNESAPTSITDEVVSNDIITLTGVQAGSAADFINVDLTGLGRWIRVDVDLTFTAGTAPTADIDSTWVFGDPRHSEDVTDPQNA